MTAIMQQAVTPVIRDPNSVSETLANGPINMNLMGNFVTLTFTQMRPDVGQLFKGKVNVEDLTAVVVSRVTMPMECLIQFKAMLDHSIIQKVPISGSLLKQ
jgi:hypothetical protein